MEEDIENHLPTVMFRRTPCTLYVGFVVLVYRPVLLSIPNLINLRKLQYSLYLQRKKQFHLQNFTVVQRIKCIGSKIQTNVETLVGRYR